MVSGMTARHELQLPDGRTLEVYENGAPDGVPAIYHYGTPGCGTPYRPAGRLAAERGIRLVTYSRAGYAGSTRHLGRSVASIAADVAAMLDALGAERAYTLGASGGGPHALATAALLPDRIIAAATIGSVAPYDAEGLDYLGGMGEENVDEFTAAADGPEALERFLDGPGAWVRSVTADDLVAAFGDLVAEPDRATLTGDYAEWLAANFRGSVASGIWGWFDDDMAFVRDWGFEMGEIGRPVTVWQGAQDRMVPFAHGQWLAKHVPGATARLLPEHGHLSLSVAAFGEILDDLVRTRPRD